MRVPAVAGVDSTRGLEVFCENLCLLCTAAILGKDGDRLRYQRDTTGRYMNHTNAPPSGLCRNMGIIGAASTVILEFRGNFFERICSAFATIF